MPEEKSALEQFLGEVGQPKDPFKSADPFATQEPAQEDSKDTEEEEVVPFHKDPKVLKFVEKQIAKAMKEVKPTVAEAPVSKETEDEITDVLTRIIGNDTPEKVNAVKDFRKALGSLEEKGAQRALSQLQEQANQETERDRQAQTELEESFEEIEDTFGVDLSGNSVQAKKIRSDFVDYVRKVAPKDRETGEIIAFPDMVSTFEEFQDKTKRSATRAKALASRGMTSSNEAAAAPAATDKSWKGIDKLFSRLSN